MIKQYTQYSLLAYNTFGIDIKADNFIEYSTVNDLLDILSSRDLFQNPVLHIGGGSNLLFTSDFKGTILHSTILGVEVVEENSDYVKIRAGAGMVWDDLVDYAVRNGWAGAENLSDIPGEVGASAVQNIGAYGIEIKDILDSVETIDIGTLQKKSFTNADCNFSYRHSIFKSELKGKYIVTHVVYKLSKKPEYSLGYGNLLDKLNEFGEVNLPNIRKAIISIRQNKLPDPKVVGNAGSFFMNPIIDRSQFESMRLKYPDIPHYLLDDGKVKIPAAWMIDQCGWKGKGVGNAAVHDKQALVIVNKGGATGMEIVELSKAIQASVKQQYGVDIFPEVNFIGND